MEGKGEKSNNLRTAMNSPTLKIHLPTVRRQRNAPSVNGFDRENRVPGSLGDGCLTHTLLSDTLPSKAGSPTTLQSPVGEPPLREEIS